MVTERVPDRLEAAVKADLRPVRPLPPPGQRAIRLAPLAGLTLIAASSIFAFRSDAPTLGWLLTWGASIAQAALGLSLIGLALRDVVPGLAPKTPAVLLAAGSVLGFSGVATIRTWDVSPTMIAPEAVTWIGAVCFTGTIVSALPLLASAALLAARALVVRAWSSGLLYGLGAGLGADAGWRLFCHYSDPLHVWPTHTGAVLAVMLLGIGISAAARARSSRRQVG